MLEQLVKAARVYVWMHSDPCDEWVGLVPEADGFVVEMQAVYQQLCEKSFRPWVRDPAGWKRGLFDKWGEKRVLTYLNRLPAPSINQFNGDV